jgi:hypothetical protein
VGAEPAEFANVFSYRRGASYSICLCELVNVKQPIETDFDIQVRDDVEITFKPTMGHYSSVAFLPPPCLSAS